MIEEEKECPRCKEHVKELHDSGIVPEQKVCEECLKREKLIAYD